jgi:thymidylate synthase (FAD)
MTDVINVLDKGYVRLVEQRGSDLTVVNAARVSYDKQVSELSEKDVKLIRFLAREGHTSPFRHAGAVFEVYAPLMVARQWWKYVVGGDHVMDAWNESSRRYITEEPTFYVPEIWREAPENSKQGSGGEHRDSDEQIATLEAHIDSCMKLYNDALKRGICAEQARLFLPAYGLYCRWYWTTSLQGIAHFINQRVAHDAQKEIQDYAIAVRELAAGKFPYSLSELCGGADK